MNLTIAQTFAIKTEKFPLEELRPASIVAGTPWVAWLEPNHEFLVNFNGEGATEEEAIAKLKVILTEEGWQFSESSIEEFTARRRLKYLLGLVQKWKWLIPDGDCGACCGAVERGNCYICSMKINADYSEAEATLKNMLDDLE